MEKQGVIRTLQVLHAHSNHAECNRKELRLCIACTTEEWLDEQWQVSATSVTAMPISNPINERFKQVQKSSSVWVCTDAVCDSKVQRQIAGRMRSYQ